MGRVLELPEDTPERGLLVHQLCDIDTDKLFAAIDEDPEITNIENVVERARAEIQRVRMELVETSPPPCKCPEDAEGVMAFFRFLLAADNLPETLIEQAGQGFSRRLDRRTLAIYQYGGVLIEEGNDGQSFKFASILFSPDNIVSLGRMHIVDATTEFSGEIPQIIKDLYALWDENKA